MKYALVLLALGFPFWLYGQARTPARRPSPATTAEPLGAPALQPAKLPILRLTVKGLKHYTPDQVLQAAGIHRGMLVDDADLDLARERLEAAAVFEYIGYLFQISPDGKGYLVEFEITEPSQVYPVRFEDLPATEEELKTTLRKADVLFGDRIPASERLLNRYCRILESFLLGRGYKQQVSAQVFDETPDQFVILFRPNLPRPNIAGFEFRGNQAIPAERLREALAPTAVGMPFSRFRFLQMMNAAIRPLYEELGLLRVEFRNIEARPDAATAGVIVTVEISEGPAYTLYDVTIDGSPVPVSALFKTARFALDRTANFTEIEQGRQRILRYLRRRGYAQATAVMERTLNDEQHTVTVQLRIRSGPEYAFGRLYIKGLDIHGEDAVRRLWTLKTGQSFDADYPDYFLEQVKARGLFEDLGKTESQIRLNESLRTVDVTLVFEGAPGPGHRVRPRY